MKYCNMQILKIKALLLFFYYFSISFELKFMILVHFVEVQILAGQPFFLFLIILNDLKLP